MNIAYSHDIEENARIIRESLSRRERYEDEEPIINKILRDEYHQALANLKETGVINAHNLRILRFFVRQQKLNYHTFKQIVFTHQRDQNN